MTCSVLSEPTKEGLRAKPGLLLARLQDRTFTIHGKKLYFATNKSVVAVNHTQEWKTSFQSLFTALNLDAKKERDYNLKIYL
ncbi:hypothetical protein FRX31_034876 [Thalictrum thalictroides]|uniref:Uncharacterized protein n=1 Tax=Thalictrum thalictroides TaxID=46969 RepID=A0A7J6USL8_THATH|nr:hypothetical protein FRX31_034876 [Thalictrum thalictroides]